MNEGLLLTQQVVETLRASDVTYTDKEVLEAILKGDDDKVLAYLYEVVLPKIKRHIIKNNGSEDDAKDIFQDSVLIFYKHVKTGSFNHEYEIAGFIFTISKNLWINLAKKKNRTIELNDETPIREFAGNVAEDLISKEREEFVLKIFSQLGDVCKELLVYSIYHRFSMKEIKEKMGFTSENVAKTKNYKCKQRLISIVKDNASIKDLLQG